MSEAVAIGDRSSKCRYALLVDVIVTTRYQMFWAVSVSSVQGDKLRSRSVCTPMPIREPTHS